MSGPLLTVPQNGVSLAVGPRHVTAPSLLILGTDATLAAVPATPVQLAHACLASGFQAVVPSSWGDELVAARAIDRLRAAETPLVQCSCPYVARRLATHADAIAPLLLYFTAPPVAAAQYLRAIYAPTNPRITYAGGCPSGSHESIDVWLSVDELLSSLAEQGISTSVQPTEFDSVIPPDRRRYFSDPGGIPSRHALRQLPSVVDLIELKDGDIVLNLAQHLLAPGPALIDLGVLLGCCCSGAVGAATPDVARARVRDHEPPRALSPIVDHSIRLPLDALPPVTRLADLQPAMHPAASDVPATPELTPEPALVGADVGGGTRRRSPAGFVRAVLGTTPLRRSEGRQLPRAYVARRRSSPRGLRQSLMHSSNPTIQRLADKGAWVWIAGLGVAAGVGLALLVRLLLW